MFGCQWTVITLPDGKEIQTLVDCGGKPDCPYRK